MTPATVLAVLEALDPTEPRRARDVAKTLGMSVQKATAAIWGARRGEYDPALAYRPALIEARWFGSGRPMGYVLTAIGAAERERLRQGRDAG